MATTRAIAPTPGPRTIPTCRAASPVVKWAGGKRKLLPELRARVPRVYADYYEPFIGGGAMFFDLMPRYMGAIVGDSNIDLVNMYVQLALDPEDVMSALDTLRRGHDKSTANNEDHFYKIRSLWNNEARAAECGLSMRAAMFIYLNKACFNGLWRVNRKGKYNTPSGNKADPVLYDRDNVIAVAQRLRGARIIHGDFVDQTKTAVREDFVYFDPPYDVAPKAAKGSKGTKGASGTNGANGGNGEVPPPHRPWYSEQLPLPATEGALAIDPNRGPDRGLGHGCVTLTQYNAQPFGRPEQVRLARHAAVLADRGVHIMISNADTLFVRQLYSGADIDGDPMWTIDTVQCGRAINRKGDGRGKVDELIITSRHTSRATGATHCGGRA